MPKFLFPYYVGTFAAIPTTDPVPNDISYNTTDFLANFRILRVKKLLGTDTSLVII